MKKRRQTGSSDLRTNPIQLSLHKYSQLPLLRAGANYLNVEHLQPFFPPIECLFKSEKLENPSEYGIKLKHEISQICSSTTIRANGYSDPIPIHVKQTMLLSPFKWMQGDYGSSLGLPTTNDNSNEINSKLQNPNNAAYIGSLIAVALSESGCQHFPKVYGVFTGIAKNHKIDISDDYQELSSRSWFSTNIGKTFELNLLDNITDTDFSHTRSARPMVQLGEDIILDDIEELETTHIESNIGELKQIMDDEITSTSMSDIDDSSSVSTSYIFAADSCDCDEEDLEIMDEQDNEDAEGFAWASFSNVPVQLTVMEKCDGLFFDLMTQEKDQNKQLAWLSQVMFALAFAQRNFGFVHNDLHSNNVMYVKTDKEYFYYSLSGVNYKVPTYGYLIKVIDFERGITSIRLNGMKEAKFFMSDHFAVNEEAGGQYNYGPFYLSKFPEIKPNPSFDLVRLATSLFWDLFPEGPNHEEYLKNPIFCYFIKWLTIESGKSVMFGNKDPHHDHYHGFTLYKAIARYCKDTAIPRKELPNLRTFYESTLPLGEDILIIDN
jgi:hypothetical protein